MTHAEMILNAVNEFKKQGKTSFTREEIRAFLGINSEDWSASFSPVIQGMRADQPGGAPAVGGRYRNVFKRLSRGVYELTDYGRFLVSSLSGQSPDTRTHHPVNNIVIVQTNSNNYPLPEIQIRRHQITNNYSEKVQLILQKAESYHQQFYQSDIFGKPCLYFHQQALRTLQEPLSIHHLEYVYATLVAWGMNRAGVNGPKMVDFQTFFESALQLETNILDAQAFDCLSMDENNWGVLEKIFSNLKIMKSGTSLVGNSKTMHHMMPNIIPPIDREYTLRFLRGNTNLQNDINEEWILAKTIIEQVFIPIASDNNFKQLASFWMERKSEYPWDTTVFKIIDNLIIGASRDNR